MKKLLLLSLVVMGATSFGAKIGSENEVAMPVIVRGTVVAKTSKDLVIEPIKNAGATGDTMEFDFHKIVQGQSQTLDGTFAVYRTNSEPIVKNDTDISNIKIGILGMHEAITKANIKDTKKTKLDADGKTSINYAVSYTINSPKTRVEGHLNVGVDVDKEATTGSFVDRSKRLAVIIGDEDSKTDGDND